MLQRLRKTGFRKGVLGSSRGWMAVWVTLAGLRLLRRVTRKEPDVVYREELKPGETLVIAHESR
jgi:hypothetical protein